MTSSERPDVASAIDDEVSIDLRRITDVPDGFFNAAAWGLDGSVQLLGRYVTERGAPGEPDKGSLMLVTVEDGTVRNLTEVWKPEENTTGDLLEDVRAFGSGDNMILGVTRLCPNTSGQFSPLPAFSITSAAALQEGHFPDTHHITFNKQEGQIPRAKGINVPSGKNATPLGSGLFMFRPESIDHGFLAFSLSEHGVAENPQHITIPNVNIPEWAERRMGSTVPPIWLNESEAILLIHGIQMVRDRYRYAIGSARLILGENGILSIDNISAQPHLTPDSFTKLFPGRQVELRPEERQAVYLCGGIAIAGNGKEPALIRVFPNVGDTQTVEATFSVPGILRNWDRTIPNIR